MKKLLKNAFFMPFLSFIQFLLQDGLISCLLDYFGDLISMFLQVFRHN